MRFGCVGCNDMIGLFRPRAGLARKYESFALRVHVIRNFKLRLRNFLFLRSSLRSSLGLVRRARRSSLGLVLRSSLGVVEHCNDSTKRGFGECSQCKGTYATRWKPAKCQRRGFHLGGTYQPATKKPKSCCPGAVVVIATKEGDMFFCSHKDCMSLRATFVSSGRAASYSCRERVVSRS